MNAWSSLTKNNLCSTCLFQVLIYNSYSCVENVTPCVKPCRRTFKTLPSKWRVETILTTNATIQGDANYAWNRERWVIMLCLAIKSSLQDQIYRHGIVIPAGSCLFLAIIHSRANKNMRLYWYYICTFIEGKLASLAYFLSLSMKFIR